MRDLSNWIQVFAGAISTIIAAVAVSHKTNRADYDAIIQEHKSERDELKKERDEFKKSYYEERELRTKTENQLFEYKTKCKILSKELEQEKGTKGKS